MRRNRKTSLVVALLVLGMLAVNSPALAGQAAAPAIAQGGTLKVATVGEPPNLDVMTLPADLVTMIGQHIFEQMFAFDEKYDVKPMLAESYSVSPDGKTYTIQLRKGVKFHNGRDMTADDVVYSFKRIIDPKTGSPSASTFETIKSIEAVDKYTVKIILSKTMPGFLSYCAFVRNSAIVPKEEVGDAQTLDIKLWVNGELRPNYNMSDAAHSIAESIAWATAITPVEPGDVLFMGTNHQGLGALQDGDHVELEISRIGRLTFNVVDPSKRRWPRGVDEVTAADVRNGTGGPGSKSRPLK